MDPSFSREPVEVLGQRLQKLSFALRVITQPPPIVIGPDGSRDGAFKVRDDQAVFETGIQEPDLAVGFPEPGHEGRPVFDGITRLVGTLDAEAEANPFLVQLSDEFGQKPGLGPLVMAHVAPVNHRETVNRPGIEFHPFGGQASGHRSAQLFPAPPVGPGHIAFEIGFVQTLEPFSIRGGCGTGTGGFGPFRRLLELQFVLHPLDDPLLKIEGRGDLLAVFPANPHGVSLDGHYLVNPFHVPILLADLELDHLLSSPYFLGCRRTRWAHTFHGLKPFPFRIRPDHEKISELSNLLETSEISGSEGVYHHWIQ